MKSLITNNQLSSSTMGARPFATGKITLVFAAVLLARMAGAQTLYWDPGAGGTGPWDASSTVWSTTSSGIATAIWSSGDGAYFSDSAVTPGSYAVTLSGTETVGGATPLTFATGTAALTGGTLALGGSGIISVTASEGIIDSSITGSAGLTKTGGGVLDLAGVNTFTGNLTNRAGIVTLDNTQAGGAGAIVLSPSAQVTLNSSLASLTVTNSVEILGISSTAEIDAGAGKMLALSGVLSGGHNWNANGPGMLVLSNANTFGGILTIEQGTVVAAMDGSLGGTGNSLIVNSNATLAFQGGFTYTGNKTVVLNGPGAGGGPALNSIGGDNTFFGPVVLTTNSEIGASAGSLELVGAITGLYNIVIAGEVAMGSSGNTYANTLVSQGDLYVEEGSSAGTGSVTVDANATFEGVSTVAAPGGVNLSGMISPGGGEPGPFGTGSEMWNAGASYDWTLGDATGAAGVGYSTLNINGTLTINANPSQPITIYISSFNPELDSPGMADDFNNTSVYSWTIATASGGIANFNPADFVINDAGLANDPGNGAFIVVTNGNSLMVEFVQKPQITVGPVSQTIDQCQPVTFSVTATGTGPLAYQWYDNNGAPIPGANSTTISDVQFANAGTYSVTVSNLSGVVVTNSATLTVTNPPPVIVTGNSITVRLNDGNYTLMPSDVALLAAGSSDHCGPGAILSTNVYPSSFDCGNVGANTVTVTLTDVSNHIVSAQATVNVQDRTPPGLVLNPVTVTLDATGNYTLTSSNIAAMFAGSSESCPVTLTTNVTKTSFTFCDVGTVSVPVTLTDIYGNTSSSNAQVIVQRPSNLPSVVYVDASYPTSCGLVNFPNSGSGGTYYYGYNAFNSIQAAVAAVATNGMINVAAGVYNESDNVNKPLTLLGANQGVPGCGSRGTESTINGGITITSTNVVVDGFTISGLESVQDDGKAGVVIQNNVINAIAVGIEATNVTSTAGEGLTVQNNCITLAAQLAGNTPTIGIAILGVTGTQAPLIVSNNVQGAYSGYLLYGLNAAAPTIIDSGSISGTMQGIDALNLNPLTGAALSPSTFEINGVTVSGFVSQSPANYATNPATAGSDFQAGVYVFTTGSVSDPVLATVTNVTVSGAGNVSPDSSGLYFTDFSKNAGLQQQITVQNCNISANENRGIFCSGSNLVATIIANSISGNGYNPYGTNGNPGFGILARNNAQVTVANCLIGNPATVTSPWTVTAVEADANTEALGPDLMVTNCSILNNGNPSGYLAGQSAGIVNASDNWWGTSSDTAITNSIIGVVDFTPYLDSGANSAANGFQGNFNVLHVTPLGAQTGGIPRVQEGVNSATGANPVVIVEPGTYNESVAITTAGLTLQSALNAGIAAWESRGAESIMSSANANGVIEISANHVTVNGMNAQGGVYGVDVASGAANATIINTIMGGGAVGAGVFGTATLKFDEASASPNQVGILVDGTGAAALLENNSISGDSFAGIEATNNAIVDAGDCAGGNVTGLGTGSGANGSSAGGNDLSGYSFAANGPTWAIGIFNNGSGTVLAENDNFGAAAGQSIGLDINNPNSAPVEYDQASLVAAAPAAVTVTCPSEVPTGATTLTAFVGQGGYYSGNTATVAFIDNPIAPYPPGNSIITRTYTISDGCSATNCVQTITVNNPNPPTFTVVPSNMSLDSDGGECGKSNVTWTASALSYCGATVPVVSTPPSGSSFSPGVNTVTLTATDASGNISTTNFTVTVIATNLPQFTVPATNETIVATNTQTAMAPLPTLAATATDPCGTPVLSQIPAAGTLEGVGTHSVTVWATDQYGNSNSCTATITVIYTNTPVISCAPDVTVSVAQDKEPYATGYPGVSDPDGPVTVTYSDNVSGLTQCDVTGNILRTWTAVDNSGNTSTCTQTITVVDTNAPYFTYVPANITVNNDPNQCGAIVNFGGTALDLGYYQGFENPNWVFNTNSANTDWDWNAYYSYGGSLSTMYRVPSGTGGIASPNGVAYAMIDSSASAPLSYASNGVFTLFNAGQTLGAGAMPFDSGYKVSLDVYINFSDPEVVNATGASGYGFDLDTGSRALDGFDIGRDFVFHVAAYSPTGIAVAADNSSNDSGTNRQSNLTNNPSVYPVVGMITHTGWYKFEWNFRNTNGVLAVDLSVCDTNHEALFSQTLSASSLPLTGNDVEFYSITNVAGNPSYLWFNFIDANQLPIADVAYQRIIPVESIPASGTQFPIGTTMVTSTATDACGNSTNTTFTVTVNDTQAPTLELTNTVTVAMAGGSYNLSPADVANLVAGSFDPCGITNVTVTPTNFMCGNVGPNSVTVVMTDAHGNSTTGTGTITVQDVTPPTLVLNPIPVTLAPDGTYTLSPTDISNLTAGSTDPCEIAGYTVTPNSFECANVGPNTVTVIATDSHGNSTTNQTTITVNDVTPPTVVTHVISVTLGADGTYTLSGSDEASMVAGSSDSCGIASTNFAPGTFNFCEVGSVPVTVTMTDVHGVSTNVTVAVTLVAPPPATNVYVDASYPTSCGSVPFPNTGGSGTYYIGYNAFNTIQAGLNAVAAGGTVTVAGGTYNESPIINNPVTLTSIGGTNAATTFIALQTNSTTYVGSIDIATSDVAIEGFTAVGFDAVGSGWKGTGLASSDVYISQSALTNILLYDNVIEIGSTGPGSNGDDGHGILNLYDTTAPFSDGITILDDTFEPVDSVPAGDTVGIGFVINAGVGNFVCVSNTFTGGLQASLTQATNALIADNIVIGNGTNGVSGGFATWGYPDATMWGHTVFEDNVITNTGAAIALYDSEDVVVQNNMLDGNGTAVSLQDYSGPPFTYDQGTSVQILNNSMANCQSGVDNETATGDPNASSNWWGNVSGPASAQNPYGTGSSVTGDVTVDSWLASGANGNTGIGFTPGPGENYPPTQLVFTTEPAGANLDSPLSQQPIVSVEDAYGNIITWVTTNITIAISNNPAHGILVGTTTESTVGGVGTFTDLTVTNDGGPGYTLIASAPDLTPALSTPFDIQNPAPSISAINPFYARTGGPAFTLTVEGANFVASSAVYWGGDALASTQVSGTELTATVPNTDIQNAGTVSVTVVSPGPGGGTSSALPFSIVPAIPAEVYVDTNYTGLTANTLVNWPYTGSGSDIIGYNAFATIQAGLNAVAAGGTVNVAAGTYNESPIINNPVTLTSIGGTNAVATIIVLQPNATQYLKGIDIAASDVTVEGFTVQGFDAVGNGLASSDVIFSQQGITNILIANNIIEIGAIGSGSDGDDGYGIINYYNTSLPYSDGITVLGNTFEPVDAVPAGDTIGIGFVISPGVGNFDCVSNTFAGGLQASLTQATNSLIADNIVIGTGVNGTSGGFATWGYPDATVWGHAAFEDNVITNTSTAIGLFDSEDVVVQNNVLDGNGTAISLQDYAGPPFTYNQGTSVQIINNSMANCPSGVDNETATGDPNASSNWWGNVSGPASAQNPYGTGSAVTGDVTVNSWLASGVNDNSGIGFTPAPGENYPPTQLAFTTEPVGANLGSPLSQQPIVSVEDAYGNPTTWVMTNITIAISHNPAFGVLAGTTSEMAMSGVATFTDLSVTADGGSGYTLVASAPGLTSSVSSPFDIANPAPGITSLSPFFTEVGAKPNGMTLTVNGNNFVADSTVEWNGTPLTTTNVSSTQLTAGVPASDLAAVTQVPVTVVSPGPGGGTSSPLTFYVEPARPTVVYVDTNYTSLPANSWVNWPYSGTGTNIVGYDAFATIQAGVNAVAQGGTVNVAAGMYAEEVTVAEPMTLLGPNAANNPNTSTRVAEAVIEPDTNGPEMLTYSDDVPNYNPPYNSNAVIGITIESSNVVVEGFTVDGYNPSLTGAWQAASDYFNAAVGIGDYNGDNSVLIENNIVKHDAYSGVDLESDTTGAPTTNSVIKDNLIENIDYNTEGFGQGIILNNNYYAEIIGNCLTNVDVGITPGNFWQANPGDPAGQTIVGNNVSASLIGIWINLVYESGSTFEVIDNTSSYMPTNGSTLFSPPFWVGVFVTSIQNSTTVVVSNNVAIGPSVNPGYSAAGYSVWNTPTTNPVWITGGSASNVTYGVWVNDFGAFLSAGGAATATISNLTVNTASSAGIYVQDDPQAADNGSPIQATVTGDTVITNSGIGVLVQGVNATASVINNSASISGNGIGISVDTGKALIQNNDLTDNSIAGISVTNNAIVDAGNCSGQNVTGLGISSGGNNLSGYGFDSVAPWAIQSFNTAAGTVLAEKNNFGATVGQNIASDISDPNNTVVYSQEPLSIAAPANVTYSCSSEVQAGATSLAEFTAQGGYYSGNDATVSFSDSDSTNFVDAGANYTDGTNVITITRTYIVSSSCNVQSIAQTITLAETPPIANVPANITVTNTPGECGANVSFTVPAPSDNCNTAVITSVTPASGAFFPVGATPVTVVVTDGNGLSDTNTFTVTVNDAEPPVITGAVNIVQAVDPGQTYATVNFTVGATHPCGVASVSASWTGNSQSTAGGTLTVTGWQFPIGTNTVTVTATDVNNVTSTSTFTVAVIGLPQITSQPQSMTNNAGTTAMFTVTATSPAMLTYQWFKGSSPLSNGGNIAGATNATLSISTVSNSDEGTYSVRVSNFAGSVISSNATLTVIDPPIITSIAPSNQTNNASTTAQFTVSATGTSPFTYQWTKVTATSTNTLNDGGNITGSTSNVLTISNVLGADQAEYVVTVSNPAGTESTNALLFVNDPAILAQPTSVTTNLGSSVSFSVTAAGTAPLSYQWQQDDVDLPGETGSTLTLNNIDDSSAGDYTVVVSNSVGEVTSDIATLTVTHPPHITSQPVSLTVNQGQTATFSVAVNGDTPFTYQWFQNNLPLSNGGNVSGATTRQLVLTSVTTVDAATYHVLITNDVGQATSSNATLTVIVPPAITNQPISVTTNAGSTVIFTVGVSGTAPAYQWYQITATATNKLMDGGSFTGSTSNVLTITNVLGADDASYMAVASNQAGTNASSYALLVVIDPIITNEPVSVTTNAGSPASFTVGAYGTSPQYQWYLNGNALAGANAATYSIASVADINAGNYTVVVSNIFGVVTSTPAASLTVIDPPIITHQPQNVTANAGGTAIFAVYETGTAPTFQWYFDNAPLNNSANVSGANSRVLTLTGVTDANRGTYSVVLSNAAATATSSNATLTVIDPPVITSLLPSSQTNNATTTAQFTVNVTGTAPFTYQWTKVTATSTNILHDGGNISGSTTNVLTITNVLAADQAEYLVTVSNPAGTVTTNGTLVVIDPVIFVQPVGQTNFTGSTVTFSVTAAGTSPLNYQWLQDGSPLFGANSSTLTLTNIADSDAGTYTVVVTNSAGSVTSAPAVLVTVSPLITTQPQSLRVIPGQSASFSVNVNGQLPFSYQWLFNGTNIPGATSRIFTIPSVAFSNAGNYQVVVQNPVGTQVSQPATLTVQTTPYATLTASPTKGGTVIFTVTSISGIVYTVQGTTNFVVWFPITTNTAPFTFTNDSGYPYEFYRALYQP